MANVQPQFDQFHEAIRLRRFGENQTLRDKRDIIRKKLCERLPGVFESHNEVCPPFSFRDQGSYEMGTGTKPLNGDFDIDQGLYFEVSTATYPDPVVLKYRVFEALVGHTKDVRIRRSCVTVFYQRDQEPIYHVDIAVYADGSLEPDGKARLAKGREHSAPEHRFWEVSNPQGLTETIFARFKDLERRQFRHVVRYLKRWRDENFLSTGYAAPLGIGLTIMAYDDLRPTFSDPFAGTPDDLEALRSMIATSLTKFRDEWDPDTQTVVRRLTVKLPVEPWNDLFARMTNAQMADFETKLKTLLAALEAASQVVDPVDACVVLRKVFGKDFPIPPREETATRHAPGDHILEQQRLNDVLDPNRFNEVLRQVEDLSLVEQARRVDATEFGGMAALEGEVAVEGHRATLCLVLDTGFPLKLPRFFLRPPGGLGVLPHIDRKGMVCFSDAEGIVLDRRNPLRIIEEAFKRALTVLANGITGRNRADFGAEIEAYWRGIESVETACSMLDPGDTVCRLVVAIGPVKSDRRFYIARDVKDFAAYYNGQNLTGTFTLQHGLFLPLEPGTPIAPPTAAGPFWTVEESRRILLNGLSDANRRRLRKVIKRRVRIKEYVVAKLPQPSGGAALFGLRFDNPGKRHPLSDGRNDGQVVPILLQRRDRSYLVERGGGNKGLTGLRVLLAGCGAVGGHLAFELVRAGILDITLVDPDLLTPENSFRHVLGRRHWGQFKAQVLKQEIEADLPYARVACHTVAIEQALLDRVVEFADYDLVILALGSPTVELQINQHLHGIQKGPPLLVTWVEPLSIGGHALLVGKARAGGCFECLYTQTDAAASFGENRAAFAAPGQSFGRDISGCGTLYTPYGSVDAVRTAVLASQLAIDALTGRELGSPLLSWKGDARAFQTAGFRLAPRFVQSESILSEGRYAHRNIGCRVCGPATRQQP